MLPIGLIGSGAEWESVWRPALTGTTRIAVAAYYDPVAYRGERIADDLEWKVLPSVRRLLQTPGLRGMLVLDSGWLAAWVVEQCDARRLPVFVTPREMGFEPLASTLSRASGDSLIQPDFRRRYTAATMRIRELTATRVGPVESVIVEVPSPSPLSVSQIAEVVDWCRFIVQSAPTSLQRSTAQAAFQVTFRKLVNDQPLAAQIRWHETTDEARPVFPSDFSAELVCRDGSIFVTGSRHVRWNAGDESGDEELSDDRPSAAVQLDLFARRLVGGLVPVPTLEDVASACALAQAGLS